MLLLSFFFLLAFSVRSVTGGVTMLPLVQL